MVNSMLHGSDCGSLQDKIKCNVTVPTTTVPQTTTSTATLQTRMWLPIKHKTLHWTTTSSTTTTTMTTTMDLYPITARGGGGGFGGSPALMVAGVVLGGLSSLVAMVTLIVKCWRKRRAARRRPYRPLTARRANIPTAIYSLTSELEEPETSSCRFVDIDLNSDNSSISSVESAAKSQSARNKLAKQGKVKTGPFDVKHRGAHFD